VRVGVAHTHKNGGEPSSLFAEIALFPRPAKNFEGTARSRCQGARRYGEQVGRGSRLIGGRLLMGEEPCS
jgi:hypothetical protein